MKLGKHVKCFKLYLMMGFWWVNCLWCHNDVIVYDISVYWLVYLWLERSLPNIEVQIKFNNIFEALNLYYNTYGATLRSWSRGYDVTEHWFLFESILILLSFIEKQINISNWI